MGEFADIANERWADGDWEEELEDDDLIFVGKTCRYCGKVGLQWTPTERGWRLADSSGLHVCDKFKKQKTPDV